MEDRSKMKRRPLFITLTVLALTVVLTLCIIPTSFAGDSWHQAWRMERQIRPEPVPDELSELIDLPEGDDWGHMFSWDTIYTPLPEHVLSNENRWRPIYDPRPDWLRTDPWYLVQP